MISYVLIFFPAYFGLYLALPIFNEPIHQNDWLAQSIRHLILLYLTTQLANFLWRQKFVSVSESAIL